MKNFIFKLRQSKSFNKTLYWLIVLFSFAYIFSIPAFSSRAVFNIISYLLVGLLGIITLTYILLFSKLHFRREMILVPVFALFCFIGTAIYSHDFRMWVSILMMSVTFLIFYYSFCVIKKRIIILEIISNAITLFTLYFIIVYAKDIIGSFSGQTVRLGTLFANVNAISAICAVGFASSLYLLFFLRTKLKFLHLINLGLIMLVGISTISRTFVFAILVFLLIFLFAKFRKRKVAFFVIVFTLVILSIILLSLPFMEGIRTRLLNAFKTMGGSAEKADTSVLERTAWLEYGFYLGMKNILFGYGANGFSIVSGVGTYTHSNFSEIICDFGLIGLVLFYLPMIICAVRCIVKKSPNSYFVIGFLAYYLIVSFSNVFYYNKNYYMILSLLFYLTYDYESVVITTKKILILCDETATTEFDKQIANSLCFSASFQENVTIEFYDFKTKRSVYFQQTKITDANNCFLTSKLSYRKAIKLSKPDIVILLSMDAIKFATKRLLISSAKRICCLSDLDNLLISNRSKLLTNLLLYFNDGFIFSEESRRKIGVIHNVVSRAYFVPIKEYNSSKILGDNLIGYLEAVANSDLLL